MAESTDLQSLDLPSAALAGAIPAVPRPEVQPEPKRGLLLGVRVDALLEIAAALAVLVLIDLWWGPGNRFLHVWPHPCGVVVLLAASYYGVREGLAAVVLSSIVVYAFAPAADDVELPTRIVLQPLAWGLAALAFGEIRDGLRRRGAMLRDELAEMRVHAHSIAAAYARLQREKEHLESRVAEQLCTVNSMYEAARAIQKKDVGDVLMGVGPLVRAVLAPEKFSLFLLNGAQLEAAICEGWKADDRFARVVDASSPLYHAVVFERRHLAAVHAAEEPILRGEGILAGPVVDTDTGGVVGMLKIEGIRFLDLHPASLQNFRILCEWIGTALSQAQQAESVVREGAHAPDPQLFKPTQYAADMATFDALAAGGRLSVRTVHLAIDPPAPGHAADAERRARWVVAVAQQLMGPQQRFYDSGDTEWPYAVLLPGASAKAANDFGRHLCDRLAEVLGDANTPMPVRYRITTARKRGE